MNIVEGQSNFVTYKKNAYVIVEGNRAECFFIVHKGRVRVSKEVEVDNREEEILKPGDFFGVVSTMSSHSHIETVLALTDVVLITIQKHQYVELIQKAPQISMGIIMLFSQQLRHLNETLAGLILKKTVIAEPPHLFRVAEFYFNNNQYTQAFYAYTQYLKYCPKGENVAAATGRLKKVSGYVKTVMPDSEAEFARTYTKNTMLFAEGEPGEELFVIQRGVVKVSKVVDDHEMILAMLEAGDIIGEMALLENKPRLANAVAFENCSVMVVNKANFEHFSASHPQLIYKVTTLLAERLWLVYRKLNNALIINPMCHMYEALLVQLEKNKIPFARKTPYIFNFGFPELCNMVGLAEQESRLLIDKMLKNGIIKVEDNKIRVVSVMELVREAEGYRKIDLIEKTKHGYEW